MDILIRGRAETLTIYRDRSVTLSSAASYDPETGADTGLTLTVANDATSAALLAAAAQGQKTIYATGLTVGTRYHLLSGDGRTLEIVPEAVDGTTVTLDKKLPWSAATGVVYGIQSTIGITVPASYTSRLVQIEATFSDSLVQQFSRLVASRRIVVPVTTEDILTRYPRLRNRGQGEVGFDAQIADVVERARDEFYRDGWVLDDIRSPSVLKNYLIAEVALLLTASGYDLIAGGDRYETRREITDMRDRELTMLRTAPNIWIDSNEDRTQDDGETASRGTIRLDWRRR